ncbi:probable protein phosphatase 2C 37 [Musa acuminata AAA Group]|uniref:probable protein phosphatase 2C 37 n=1 Tax=Musa acuminata AAA Group TaxID=214697 RepID=UPI0031D3A072
MGSEGDSPENCPEARRQRIEMRILGAAGEGAGPPSRKRAGKLREAHEEPETSGFSVSEKRNRFADGGAPSPRPQSSSLAVSSSSSTSSASDGEPVSLAIGSTSGSVPAVAFGSISLAGRSREMEDAVSIQPDFFRAEGGPSIHFFAVFDGHGGSHVAALCKGQMHVLLAEELGRAETETERERDAEAEEARIKTAIGRSFARMDELALMACACGTIGLPPCGCERSGTESEIVGSTAVVALVGGGRLVVANCGDSRAVLSRGGRAVPLSDDHKPDRPDELARIEAAGGRVIYLNGARVYGILAMSRALGDKYLKPAVISEPEIRVVEITAADECLIIASDGLWDVLPNDLACDVARRCLEEADPTRGSERLVHEDGGDTAGDPEKEHASDARCSLAAALLARLALGRRSADNISVVVIDLRRTRGRSA